jgi:hypothetical protein
VRAQILRFLWICSIVTLTTQAASVSLTNDFSLASNPNGQWAYQNDLTNLTFQIPVNNGNAFYPAVSGGYWGVGNDLNTNTPDLGFTQVNGAAPATRI